MDLSIKESSIFFLAKYLRTNESKLDQYLQILTIPLRSNNATSTLYHRLNCLNVFLP